MSKSKIKLKGKEKEAAYNDVINLVKIFITDGKIPELQGKSFLNTAKDNQTMVKFIKGIHDAMVATEHDTWGDIWECNNNTVFPKELREIVLTYFIDDYPSEAVRDTILSIIQAAARRNPTL